MSDSVHIPLNKRRLTIQIALFVVAGLGGMIGFFALAESTSLNPLIWQAMGVALCFFAIIAAGSKAKKRSDKNGGLIINKDGITDNSSDLSLGFIPWKSIQQIDEELCLKNEYLIIGVRKPGEFVKKAKNSAIKRLLEQNIRNFDTPVVIEPNTLKASLEELLDIIKDKRK